MKISDLAKQIHPSWQNYISKEFRKDYMISLGNFIESEKVKGKTIFPKEEHIFSAFQETPFNEVKVVIIGQDPYHGENQAHGMCFSVLPGIKVPPSLKNIYKELEADLAIPPATDGYLIKWAKQGVLLINAVLTVEKGKAGSHHKKGWEQFTDKVIDVLNRERTNLVFLLWGAPAQKKAASVDQSKHCILKTVHPSPLSSYRGWFGCKHFSKANEYLKSKHLKEIDWSVSE